METKVVPHYAYLDSHGLYHGKHLTKTFRRNVKKDVVFELLMLHEKFAFLKKKVSALDNYVFHLEKSPPRYYIEKIPARNYFRGERDKIYNWIMLVRAEISRFSDSSARRMYNNDCDAIVQQVHVMDIIMDDLLDISIKNYVLRLLGLGVA